MYPDSHLYKDESPYDEVNMNDDSSTSKTNSLYIGSAVKLNPYYDYNLDFYNSIDE